MKAFIAGYSRTPFAKFNGTLATESATMLGAHAVTAALAKSGVLPENVDILFAGQVLQAGAGQNPARQTAFSAGIPLHVPALTLNAVCLSGTEAITQAARYVSSGEADIVVAVGQESMSLAPHLIHMRSGVKYGSVNIVDSVDRDGLTDAFANVAMGALTEEGNHALGITRNDQDAFAEESQRRAAESADFLSGEIAPYTVTSKKGELLVSVDDGIRTGSVSQLRPAFSVDGTITAGNASQITDGAAALVIVSEAAVTRYGLQPIAVIEATALVAGPDTQLHSQPARAILSALAKLEHNKQASELDAIEINEAFSAVALQSAVDLGIDPLSMNRHGGAIALGHPIGASGARIVGTLARQLAAIGPGATGAAGICGGGGQGSAVVLSAI